ncbi:hypothetical protein GCM10017710_24900 [Arthrobacter ramosus]
MFVAERPNPGAGAVQPGVPAAEADQFLVQVVDGQPACDSSEGVAVTESMVLLGTSSA